jgi:hypothetical protein
MEMFPLSQLPSWLTTKLQREIQRQKELEELGSEGHRPGEGEEGVKG